MIVSKFYDDQKNVQKEKESIASVKKHIINWSKLLDKENNVKIP